MTEVTTPPPGDRVEPVGLEVEMQRSFLDYAMSVIVSRALPDVRDGLKPVHRRVLYAMYDGGYRPDRGYSKCSRVVGDVMGQYHPHGDSAIYDTLVRLAQPWAMRLPLVDGQGNFGSPGNDPPAAMRYCVVGSTTVDTADGPIAIGDIVPGAEPNSDHDIDVKVVGVLGEYVLATKLFHSGAHPTYEVVTADGRSLAGTGNHPVLALVQDGLRRRVQWLLLDELLPGDVLVVTDGGLSQDYFPSVREAAGAGRELDSDVDVDALRFARVVGVRDAGVQDVFSVRVDSADHAFVAGGFVNHNTECRLAPVAMEMLRDIDQDTVDFTPNYDQRGQEPLVLPSRFPNLLVNGAAGIAVGMATNIPPHNLQEVSAAVQWFLDNPDASDEELLEACVERVKGPDFPTGALIVGRDGIDEALRTGRGSIRMRAVIEVEEDKRGRHQLVVTELPYQVNPDALAEKIADLVREGKIGGIADVKDESSARTGQRLVIVLKRDAVAKVVLNNLYKHTQLQDTFGVNMLALVDGVPRTLNIGQMVRYYVAHQVEVIVRRTRFRLRKAQERAHILVALLKAQDRIDEVIALIRASESANAARTGLMELLDIDEVQATAILDMQLRRLAALERQALQDEYDALMREIADYEAILASPQRQRSIIGEELGEIAGKYGNERRSRLVAYEGDMSMEDLIAEEDVVVTISRGGYAKRTKTDLYRAQKRGGKGVQGAALKQDDIVEHFFVTSTHHWILFFTNKGRVYRAKAHELPETTRAARGQHVANILAFQPGEHIAQVMDIKDYAVAPYLVLATKHGLVKKTALTEFDSNRTGGIVAINLRESDELISAALMSGDDDLLLVSRKAMSIRFHATDDALRPMGRATSGVIGMRFAEGDELLSMDVVTKGSDEGEVDLLVATDGGFAKRTRVKEYSPQGRGGRGVFTAKIVSTRGQLVGALVVRPEDELFAIRSDGGVIRTSAGEVRRAGRQTMGVRLINLPQDQSVVAIARNAETDAEAENS
ncbi:MAG TPA: DNA gyrase subunit A [Mycobacteriales bacterium]|nr:DNA gyrase subunit A [Mycobacteriales bacterium]